MQGIRCLLLQINLRVIQDFHSIYFFNYVIYDFQVVVSWYIPQVSCDAL